MISCQLDLFQHIMFSFQLDFTFVVLAFVKQLGIAPGDVVRSAQAIHKVECVKVLC